MVLRESGVKMVALPLLLVLISSRTCTAFVFPSSPSHSHSSSSSSSSSALLPKQLPFSASSASSRADTLLHVGRRTVGLDVDIIFGSANETGVNWGDAENEDEARTFLNALSGRRHKVITAVAVKHGDRVWQKDVQTSVAMRRLTKSEIDWYIATGDWQGKAGGYGIQGPASAFIPWLNGSFHAVMGLPLPEALGLLRAAGYPVLGETP